MSYLPPRRQGRPLDLSVSQNFLTSTPLLHRIVGKSSITRQDTVVEIGAGKGHLTRVLSQRCHLLYAIELDRQLYLQAQKRLQGIPNLRLIHGDFLTWPLPKSGPYKVFANIPYAITTRIVDKLTGANNPPTDIWLVVERGAALRFLGKPRDNRHSLVLKTAWEMRICHHFNREDFHPKPRVDSVLVHLHQKEQPDLAHKEAAAFRRFVSQVLSRGLFSLLTKKQASTALRLQQLPPLEAGRPTLYIQWLCLFRWAPQFGKA